jgi:hypothetical protein
MINGRIQRNDSWLCVGEAATRHAFCPKSLFFFHDRFYTRPIAFSISPSALHPDT